VAGLAISFGSGAMTNSISEIANCHTMFVIGSNPPEAHPVIGTKMRQALRRGAKLIVADPRKTELAAKADIWLQLKPGTDIALVNGMINVILENGWEDKDFIGSCTHGFTEMAAGAADYTLEKVAEITGVSCELLVKAAKMYAKAERAAIFYTLGITEHITGTDNVMTLANLAMLTGNIGKPSSGVNPLRGQNNVQGACDMGALPDVLPGYQKIKFADSREKFAKGWGRALPEGPGLTIPAMFDAAADGHLKAMYIMGEDPVLTDANANHVEKALNKLDFLVVQNLFLTETAKLADVVLPAASFAEKDGTFTNTERRVQRVRQAIDPIGDSRPDWQIIADLSARMGYRMEYAHPREIMAEMTALSPIYAGVTYERIDQAGLQWPVPDEQHPGTPFLHENGRFSCGLGYFVPTKYLPPAEVPDAEYPLLLTTGRILYHYNVSTHPYSTPLTTFRPNERTMISSEDAAALGIADSETIVVSSRRGRIKSQAWVTDIVSRGVVWMSFHYAASRTNQLTNDAADRVTSTYEYKVCAVKIEKDNDAK
jgi:formate dehydrogenase (NADP+) alpha subunit